MTIEEAKSNIDTMGVPASANAYQANLSGNSLSIGASDIAPESGPMEKRKFEGVWRNDSSNRFTFTNNTYLIERDVPDGDYDKERGTFTYTETNITFTSIENHSVSHSNWQPSSDAPITMSYSFTNNDTFTTTFNSYVDTFHRE
jgi:hypothetical protein